MRLDDLISRLGCRPLALADPAREVASVYVGDLLSWVMGRAEEDSLWLTIMTNINVVAVASLTGVSAVLLCEGCEPDAEVLAAARERGINLLVTDDKIYEACLRLGAALQ